MRISKSFEIDSLETIKDQLLSWSKKFEVSCLLNNNNYPNASNFKNHYEFFLGVGVKEEFEILRGNWNEFSKFEQKQNELLLGFLSYDLKNEFENLQSNHEDHIKMPLGYFFIPQYIFEIRNNRLHISSFLDDMDMIFKEIITISAVATIQDDVFFKHRISKEEYISSVNKLKDHIKRGDIYEVNFCQEFFAEKANIKPLKLYKTLNSISPSPFSVFFKFYNKYLISATPERYIKKEGQTVISQPIKGTIRRGKTEQEDEDLKNELKNNPKERSENVMIVDLVRNDLSRVAEPGSVKVDELFGIYSFKQVHQMISTVSCNVRSKTFSEIIEATFPMGSMTGAPKIRAMELIEEYESVKRGLYSGTVGYISVDKDFDFNVVIRSMIYNSESKYLSFITGSAITFKSDPESEYEECLLKAKAMMESLKVN